MKAKILFMGTPEFAIPCLKKLASNDNYQIVGVVTKPDKPKGRGLLLTPPPVKTEAEKLNLPVFQPKSLKKGKTCQKIKELEIDIVAVVAYGKFLPEDIIDLPKIKTINIHPSLLPKYRGAAPLYWPIINGDTKTGVSCIFLTDEMDAGDIVLKREIEIGENDDLCMMHDKLAVLGADCLCEAIDLLMSGQAKPQTQDSSEVTFAEKITPENSRINWNKTAKEIHNFIRGLSPIPGAHSTIDDKKVTIYKSRLCELSVSGVPGSFACSSNDGFLVNTGDGTLELLEIHLENKRRMSCVDFINGYKKEIKFI
ncbi:MAG: methionyl-tRNA formyltransferase [Pseudomonadota bacterium]